MLTRLLLIGLSFVLLFSCDEPSSENVGIEVGKLAPNIVTQDIQGRQFDLEDLQGEYVVLDFWGSWCGPCIREAPEISAIHEEFNDRGLQIVSIAIEKNDKNWKRAADVLGFAWQHQIVQVSQFVRFNEIASDYQVTDIPSLYLLDPEGRIIASKVSASEIHSMLKELL